MRILGQGTLAIFHTFRPESISKIGRSWQGYLNLQGFKEMGLEGFLLLCHTLERFVQENRLIQRGRQEPLGAGEKTPAIEIDDVMRASVAYAQLPHANLRPGSNDE